MGQVLTITGRDRPYIVSKLLARLLATAVLWVRSSLNYRQGQAVYSVFYWKWMSKLLARLLDTAVLWVRSTLLQAGEAAGVSYRNGCQSC